MLPRKSFEPLHTVMAILVHFKQFLRQILINFLALNFQSFTKYCTFSIHACLGRNGLLLLKRIKIMEKLYSSKTLLKMAGGRDTSPESFPGDRIVLPRSISTRKL